MPPRKQRNRDQQPELRLVDQQSEQSAGEQRPSLERAQAEPNSAAVQVLFCPPTALMKTARRARLGPASPDAVRDRKRTNPPPATRAAPARGP